MDVKLSTAEMVCPPSFPLTLPPSHPMEFAALVSELTALGAHALLARAERAEVLHGFGDGVAVQAKDDAARGLVGGRKGKKKS